MVTYKQHQQLAWVAEDGLSSFLCLLDEPVTLAFQLELAQQILPYKRFLLSLIVIISYSFPFIRIGFAIYYINPAGSARNFW